MALKHLENFSHVGFTETFAEDRDIILSKLGISPPKQNTFINKGDDRPTAQDLFDSTVRLLREITGLEQIIYDQVWSSRYS